MDLLHNELVNAQESADELEEEMEELLDSRAKMRVEVHEAHCQVGTFLCISADTLS